MVSLPSIFLYIHMYLDFHSCALWNFTSQFMCISWHRVYLKVHGTLLKGGGGGCCNWCKKTIYWGFTAFVWKASRSWFGTFFWEIHPFPLPFLVPLAFEFFILICSFIRFFAGKHQFLLALEFSHFWYDDVEMVTSS